MNRWVHTLTAFAAIGLAPGSAKAACEVTLTTPAQVWFQGESNGYDGLESTPFETRFSVQLTNNADEACEGFLSFQHPTGQDSLEKDADELRFTLSQTGSRASVIDLETNSNVSPNAIPVNIGANQRITKSFSFVIPPRQLRPSGVYSEQLLIRLFDRAEIEIAEEETVLLSANVRQQASILVYDGQFARGALPGGGAEHRIVDLGKLEKGKEASVNLLIQSNDGFDIVVQSRNAGFLTHDTLGANQRIAYSAFLDQKSLYLAGGDDRVSGKRATSITGSVMNFRVQIGEVGTARAGRYEDLITISVLPD